MRLLNAIFSAITYFLVYMMAFILMVVNFWLIFVDRYKRYKWADIFLVMPYAVYINRLLLFMRIKIIGKEYVDKKRKSLYICNHQSYLDIATFVRFSHAVPISKKEVRKIPFIGRLAEYASTIFFDRTNKSGRLGAIKEIKKMFDAGVSLSLFPEGTRTIDGTVGEPMFAVIKMCYKFKIPVVPTAIHGTVNILPKKQWNVKYFQRVVLKFNEPVYPECFNTGDEFCEYCWNKVIESHREIVETYFGNCYAKR